MNRQKLNAKKNIKNINECFSTVSTSKLNMNDINLTNNEYIWTDYVLERGAFRYESRITEVGILLHS